MVLIVQNPLLQTGGLYEIGNLLIKLIDLKVVFEHLAVRRPRANP